MYSEVDKFRGGKKCLKEKTSWNIQGENWNYLTPHQLLVSGILNAPLCYHNWGAKPSASTLLFWGSGNHPGIVTTTQRKRLMELTALLCSAEHSAGRKGGGDRLMMGRSLSCWLADSTVFQAKIQLLKGPIKPSPAQPSAAKARLHLQRPLPWPSGLGRVPFSKWGSDVIF